MARGSSQSQTTSSAGGAARPGTVGPRGTPAATAGMRRRRPGGGGGGSSGFTGGGGGSNMLRFYTDDAPGLKMSPTVVLVMSLCFIGFVTALHVSGKLYRYRAGGTSWSATPDLGYTLHCTGSIEDLSLSACFGDLGFRRKRIFLVHTSYSDFWNSFHLCDFVCLDIFSLFLKALIYC